ncbi:MAG: hypothetical protein VW239_02055 [Candidatus Nanopelagicales bacterium]
MISRIAHALALGYNVLAFGLIIFAGLAPVYFVWIERKRKAPPE